MSKTDFDLIVIGAGPGGYVAAIRGAQLGLKVACVEKELALGGTCLRVGCIPSKALLESSELYHEAKTGLSQHGVDVGEVRFDLGRMLARKDEIVAGLTSGIAGLFKKNGIERVEGHASLQGRGEDGQHRVSVDGASGKSELRAPTVLLATGSAVAGLPGVEFDGDRIGGSTEALSYPDVPEHLIVIGAGVIGLELGSVWLRLGAKVTVLEHAKSCFPGMDADLVKHAKRLFKKQGFKFHFGARVTGAHAEGEGCLVDVEGMDSLTCDRVLVAVGRNANTEGLGLDQVGIETERGCIPVDGQYRTSAEGILAIGDVIPGPMLAHLAEDEGMAAVEFLVNGHGHVDYNAIPAVVYTDPEIASVGKAEHELVSEGIAFKKGSFPFQANGRARAMAKTDGMIKILADAKTDRVLGVHMIGPRVSELIAEAATAMSFGASAEDIARVCHAHPALQEVMREAALAVDGRAIHI